MKSFIKNIFSLSLFIFVYTGDGISQDTFSICAVDSATGQVGSAGATCIQSSTISALIISDVHPGVGVVHTQASWIAANQNYARTLMNMGLSPQQIIDSVVANDIQNNPAIRQYGVVDLVNGGRSAAYTGVNCLNYKNHITGTDYSIQGNILLGQQILDSMEAAYLNTQESLACKLMAALQGAKVVGADTRCINFGISSYSAFIRVANPGDSLNNLYLDISVNTYPGNLEPIDSLQVMFNNWGGCGATYVQSLTKDKWIKIYPNPVSNQLKIEFYSDAEDVKIFNGNGNEIISLPVFQKSNITIDAGDWKQGLYFVKVQFKNGEVLTSKFVKE